MFAIIGFYYSFQMKTQMKTQTLLHKNETGRFIFPLLVALVITLFLFYIDEGFYDFRWMLNIGNWIVFLVYVSAIYGIQLLFILPFYRFFTKFILTLEKFVLIILTLFFLLFIIFH
jgi:hypothetical protein